MADRGDPLGQSAAAPSWKSTYPPQKGRSTEKNPFPRATDTQAKLISGSDRGLFFLLWFLPFIYLPQSDLPYFLQDEQSSNQFPTGSSAVVDPFGWEADGGTMQVVSSIVHIRVESSSITNSGKHLKCSKHQEGTRFDTGSIRRLLPLIRSRLILGRVRMKPDASEI